VKFISLHICHSFVNLAVKTALKSVDFEEVIGKNKLAAFYGHGVVTMEDY